MRIRSFVAALSLAAGSLVATQAGAFFYADDRPPPNGKNGFSVNGFSVNGFSVNGIAENGVARNGMASVGAATVAAVMLQDGSVVILK